MSDATGNSRITNAVTSALRIYGSTRLKVGRKRDEIVSGIQVSGGLAPYIRARSQLALAVDDCPVYVSLGEHGTVVVRPRSTDWGTLTDTLIERYHRPYVPLPPRATIVDLGCNVGYTLIDFRKLYPDARIIGVELDSRNYRIAEFNTAGLDITLLNAAIWKKDIVVRYQEQGDYNGLRVEVENDESRMTEVQGISMGALFDMYEIDRVDYLKVDIEGAEIPVLFEGNIDWLARVDQISVEIHDDSLPRVLDLLRAHGMTAISSENHWATALGWR